MKKFSFLFLEEPIRGKISDIGFALDDMLSYFISNEVIRNVVRDIIAQFENNERNIIYRQELIKDMIKHNGLVPDLFSIMNKVEDKRLLLSKLMNEFKEAKKQIYSFFTRFRNLMTESVDLFIEILRLYAIIDDTLGKYNHQSKALSILREHIEKTLNNESINKIKDIITKALPTLDKIIIDLNNQLNIVNIDFVLPNKDSRGKSITIPVNNKTQDEFNYVYNTAARDTIEIILSISYYLLDFFNCGIDELEFYQFALKYYKTLRILNIPYCFPEITDKMEFKGLYEINLLISKVEDNGLEVKSNDFNTANACGCVIVGPNNTGKTVFLRSLVIAQILGQAGLFIPAEAGSIRINKQLSIMYATTESSETGGRFEQEVRTMSEALDQLQAGDMVVLNEYFQSTTENECINILYDIFTFFQTKNIYWIAVTNFQSIISKQQQFIRETNNKFKALQTNTDYQIKELN